MSHKCGRPLSAEVKLFNVFNKQAKTKGKHCRPLNRFTANSKGLCTCSHTDVPPNMKRLKSRKERSQMRAVWRESSKTKSHHQHPHPNLSKDTAHFNSCCHSICHCPSLRQPQFTSVCPAAHEPSIITGKRLIGHHGLFNHEVKSVDIERLLSEQKKVEKAVQRGKDLKKARSISTEGLGADDPDIPADWKAETALKADDDDDDGNQKTKESSQFSLECSDITSGHKPQQLVLSSGSANSMVSPKQSPVNAVATTSPKSNDAAVKNGRNSHLTPIVDRRRMERKGKKHLISTLEQNQNDLEKPAPLIQACGLSQSSFHLSSSPTADSLDIQNRRQDPKSVSERVGTVAAQLCGSLQFPFLRKKNLVAESKEVLLKSLLERHGPCLQENLLPLRECQDVDVDPTKAAQDLDPDPFLVGEDGVFPAEMTERRHLNSRSSSRLNQRLPQTAEWMIKPVGASVSVLDEVTPPRASSPFCMDFEPFRASVSDSFASFPTSQQDNKDSWFRHQQDTLNRSNRRESLVFDSFDYSFLKHTKAFKEQRDRSKTRDSWQQPLFPFQSQEPDRHSVDPRHFSQERDTFGTFACSSSSAISAPLYRPSQSSHSHTFNKFYPQSNCPPQGSHHSDMMQFPPSHMLEKASTIPSSSFPSPEQWSFPPMRLY